MNDSITPPSPSIPSRRSALGSLPRGWWLAAAVILGLRTLVLVASVSPRTVFTGDESTYSDVAHNILSGRGYSHAGQPWVLRPPGWPLTLAAIYRVFGTSRRTIVLWQGLFDCGTALLSAWLAGRIYRSRNAVALAFLLVALWPPLFRESRFMQTEPMFTLGVALLACEFGLFVARPSSRSALLSGLTAGLLALIRPTGLLLLFGLLLGWLLSSTRPNYVRCLGMAALMVAGVVIVVAPWAIRNAWVFDRFIPISTGGGEMFYTGTTPETDGRWNQETFVALTRPVLEHEQRRLGHALDPVEKDHALLRAGLENWRHDPARSATITLKRFFRLCFLPLSANERPLLRLGFLAALLALYALAVPQGIAGLRSREGWPAFRGMVWVAVVMFVITSSLFYTNSRYLEPLRPLLLVLAAGAVAGAMASGFAPHRALASLVRQRRRGPA